MKWFVTAVLKPAVMGIFNFRTAEAVGSIEIYFGRLLDGLDVRNCRDPLR